MYEDEVALLPVVALVVVDLVAAAFEDVERRFVLVAVAVVRAVRRQFHEVDLDRLGQERVVARSDPPPRARLRRVARVGGAVTGVHDDGVVPDPRRGQLLAPEVAQTVRLRRHAANEYATVLTHGHSLSRRCVAPGGVGIGPAERVCPESPIMCTVSSIGLTVLPFYSRPFLLSTGTERLPVGNIHLSIATTDYDHFRDFRLGTVTAQGIEHTWSILSHHEVFARFTAHREWDVAELSIAKFSTQVTRDNPDIVGLPVICSRVFRFGAFYVNRNSGITSAEDLRGKRIGSPEWAHSAAVYMRGWLHNDVGVKLDEVEWVQAGANAAGREEKVELIAARPAYGSPGSPTGRCRTCSPPATSTAPSSPGRRRAFSRAIRTSCGSIRTSRSASWRPTRAPGSGRSCTSSRCSAGSSTTIRGSPAICTTRSWSPSSAASSGSSIRRCRAIRCRGFRPTRARMTDAFGGDPFPYGIEPNRSTVDQLLQYAYQQGIAHRLATPDEVFPTGIMTKVVV